MNSFKIPTNYYLKKKARGIKSKLIQLENRLDNIISDIPNEDQIHDKYYHFHLPCSARLVDSKKSSNSFRRDVLQLLINYLFKLDETEYIQSKKYLSFTKIF